MEKLHFIEEEVIGFIEDKIKSNEATENEITLYEDALLFGKLKKFNRTYRCLIEEMRDLFECKY
jgi:hypothetical protein